jgi:DNA-binding transcriptional MerR regulator
VSNSSSERLIGSVEAADILGVAPATITRWVAKGTITPAAKGPGQTGPFLFSLTEIVRLAQDRLARRAGAA